MEQAWPLSKVNFVDIHINYVLLLNFDIFTNDYWGPGRSVIRLISVLIKKTLFTKRSKIVY